MKAKQLAQNLTKWAQDRKITTNGVFHTQILKVISEAGELADNLAKGKDIKDDIGDIFIALSMAVLVCKQQAISIEKLVSYAYNPHPLPCVYLWVFDNVRALVRNIGYLKSSYPVEKEYLDIVGTLSRIAELEGYSLKECIEYAYYQIKDRKGYLNENGVFIKEEQ